MACLDVEAFDCCTCLYVCIASAVCDFLISAVWRKLTNKGCASNSEIGKTGSETFEILKQAFGDSCMRRRRTSGWFGRFENGRSSTANDDPSGRPRKATNPSKVEQVGRLSTRIVVVPHDLCAEVGIGYGTCQQILTEQLNMHRNAAKFVLRVMTQDLKDSRVAICQELKETVINVPPLLLNIITGDESIIYAYDPETKLQSSQWKSPGSQRPKKARMQTKQIEDCSFVSLSKRGSTPGICPTCNEGSMQTTIVMF